MARQPAKRNSMLVDDADTQETPEVAPAKENSEDKIRSMGGNIAPLHKAARDSKERIDQWKKERRAINDKIKAERESMEAQGITKTAFDAAMAYVDMDASKREGFDMAYIISREAFGAPVKGAQLDLLGEPVKGDK